MRNVEVDLERDEVSADDVLNRINKRKKVVTPKTVKRMSNRIEQAVAAARDLVISGALVNTGKQRCVTDIHTLRAYCTRIIANGEYALDLETSGLNPHNNRIVGFCIYTPNLQDARLYVPVGHTDTAGNLLEGQLTVAQVCTTMQDVFDSCGHINHLSKFDGKFMRQQAGVTLKFKWDTWVAGKILNENELTHELKPLYAKYVEKRADWKDAGGFADLFGKTIPFNYIPIEVATIYGADDGYKAYKLYEFQRENLRCDHPRADMVMLADLFETVEMPLIPAIIDMELTGICCDTNKAMLLQNEMVADLAEIENKLHTFVNEYSLCCRQNAELVRLAGIGDTAIKLSFGSPKQLSIFIYEVLGCPLTRGKSKKAADGSRVEDKGRGTGEDIIEKLKGFKAAYRPFFEGLLRYRELDKLLGTYVVKLPNEINPTTGRIHGSFNQYGAATGRFSSSEPNMQNIPAHEKRIRKIFTAAAGNVLISADYSQIEPRVLAYFSDDKNMKAAYAAGQDLYSAMASIVFGKTYEECGDGTDERKRIKAILLGIMYEKSPETIAKEFGKPAAWGIKLVADFYAKYPAIQKWKQKTIFTADTLGYVTTVMGRKRRLPVMQGDKETNAYAIAFRQAVNARIQGTSADITKLAMIMVYNNARLREIGYKTLLTVHDELIGECPSRHAKEGSELMRSLMIEAAQLVLEGMPIKVDVEVSQCWYGETLDVNLL